MPMSDTLTAYPPFQPGPSADVLLLGLETTTAKLAPILRGSCRVAVSSTASVARAFLGRNGVDVLVTDIDLPDSSAVDDLCRDVKRFPKPPAVLVMTEHVERVPDALAARCDGVLLKPFAPNLLVGRVARLLRARKAPSQLAGTNQFWPMTSCPYCATLGVTSFEFTSHRRAWYACGSCKKTWIGRRQE